MKRLSLLLVSFLAISAASPAENNKVLVKISKELVIPYQANLIIVNPADDTEEHCSGAIIHQHWIVTAAHCFARFSFPRYLHVTVGASEFSGATGTRHEYEAHFVHEDWVMSGSRLIHDSLCYDKLTNCCDVTEPIAYQ